MTRKTKEEKKLADYRRKLKLLQQSESSESFSKTEITDHDEHSKPEEKITDRNIDPDQTFFMKDLKKSLIFIFLIITLEIIIYFARINR